MPKKREVNLTAEGRRELEQAVRSHPKAYVRERAAAVLKVAGGMSAVQVARHGLLRRHSPDSVNLWLNRYAEEGIAGLMVRPGRGRKPAFFPSAAECASGE